MELLISINQNEIYDIKKSITRLVDRIDIIEL